MSEELKRCPFCGGKVQIEDDVPEYSCEEQSGCYVFCPKCSLYFGYGPEFGGEFPSKGEAVKVWNRRIRDEPGGMGMKDKLKVCPFCGGEAEAKTEESGLKQVSCSTCGTHTLWSINAHSAWNKRRRAGIELKPCPCCGGSAKLHEAYDGKYCVQCKDC